MNRVHDHVYIRHEICVYSMFLDERFIHKCSLVRRSLIRFADQPVPKKRVTSFSVGLPLTLCAYLVCLFERIVHSICLILQRKNFSSSAIIPCHVLISQNVVRVKWFHFHFEANAFTNEQNSSALSKRFIISLAVLIGYSSGQHSPILPARDYLLCSRARK